MTQLQHWCWTHRVGWQRVVVLAGPVGLWHISQILPMLPLFTERGWAEEHEDDAVGNVLDEEQRGPSTRLEVATQSGVDQGYH